MDKDACDTLTDACIAAHEAVTDHGTPEMQMLTRSLLLLLAEHLTQVRGSADGGALEDRGWGQG